MSYDLDVYLRTPECVFSEAIRAAIAETQFEGEIIVSDDWSAIPTWTIFDDAVRIEPVTSESLADEKLHPDLLAAVEGATHRVRVSFRMSSAPAAIELAALFARYANGTIFDYQGTIAWLRDGALAHVPRGNASPEKGIYDAAFAQAIADVMNKMVEEASAQERARSGKS